MSSEQLNQQLVALKKADEEFFNEAFTNPVTRQPYVIPNNLRNAATSIVRSYGIKGICDPMYIANVIALNLGLGDGKSNFKP